jgi:ABC-type Mn2+/Zn2+ transport system ATPase subunit
MRFPTNTSIATNNMTSADHTPHCTVHAEGLSVGYEHHTIVADVDLHLMSGELVALIGTNGSGKSTLLKTLAGLLTPLAGEVRILGEHPGRSPKRVAYLPQHPVSSHTLPLRARDVVAMGRYAHLGLLRRESSHDREVVRASVERTGAEEFAHLPLRELSGGQQQRTHLAQVLAREAEVLLLDEPTAGLDIAGKGAVARIIAEERARGTTVVVATHDLEEAGAASSVMLLAQCVVAFGPPAVALRDDYLRECFGFTQPH